jgi:hypothetical protein
MKVKLNFPIDLEAVYNKINSTMVGNVYPLTLDGITIGTGKVLECNGFDIIFEVDKDAENFYNENFTKEERFSFEIA